MSDEPVIFIVDDDPAIRDSLDVLLTSQGHAVRSFDSAVAFLASDAPAHPGCVLADVRMPQMDGLELQEKLREQGSALPVILIASAFYVISLLFGSCGGLVRQAFPGRHLEA